MSLLFRVSFLRYLVFCLIIDTPRGTLLFWFNMLIGVFIYPLLSYCFN